MNEERDWPGLAAFVLAACLGIGWAAAVIIAATPWGPELNDQSANLFNGIGQVLAGALATYLGVRVGQSVSNDDTAEDTDDYEEYGDLDDDTDAGEKRENTPVDTEPLDDAETGGYVPK